MRRAVKSGGHLVLSYANRDAAAQAALLGALQPLERFMPTPVTSDLEASFCHTVGTIGLRVGSLAGEWRSELFDTVSRHPFVA